MNCRVAVTGWISRRAESKERCAGLNRLRDGVRANAFDAVLILSPDRLSRKSADLIHLLEEFERFATPVVFVEQPLLQPVMSVR